MAKMSTDPASWDYVILLAERDVAEVIKFRILRWDIILDYPDGLNVITRVLARERQEGQSQGCDNRSRSWSPVPCSWRKEPEPRSTGAF